MANEHIKSLNDANTKIQELQNKIKSAELEIKELQSRSSDFVDNPNNILNKQLGLSKTFSNEKEASLTFIIIPPI